MGLTAMNVAGLVDFDVVNRPPQAFDVAVADDPKPEGAQSNGRGDHDKEDEAKVYCKAGGLRA